MSKKNRMIVPSKPNNSEMVEIPTENNEVEENSREIIVDAPVESPVQEVEKEIIVEQPEEVVVVEEPKEEPATEEPSHEDLYAGVKTEKVVEEVIVEPPVEEKEVKEVLVESPVVETAPKEIPTQKEVQKPVEKKQEVKDNVPKKQITNQEPQVYKTSEMNIEHWIVIRKSTLAPKLRARLDVKNIPYVVSDKEDYIFVGPYSSLEEAKKNRKLIRGSGIPVIDIM